MRASNPTAAWLNSEAPGPVSDVIMAMVIGGSDAVAAVPAAPNTPAPSTPAVPAATAAASVNRRTALPATFTMCSPPLPTDAGLAVRHPRDTRPSRLT